MHVNSKRRTLSVSTVEDVTDDNFVANGSVFIKDDLAIDSNGVAMRNNPKIFSLQYDELELGEIIGRGQSSVVLYGLHVPSSTPLALKVINLCDKNKREQLIREIAILYDAQCPNLITFYGAFYREGAITIALEYMDGGSLANVIDQVGKIPEFALVGVAYQVLWGLAYLKHHKRVHRDIKPSNLLINSKGEVKVSDFGISAELQSSIQMCGTFVGTFKYMSPERIRNQPYGYLSDIWSFGIVMYECATSNYPFPQDTNCIEMAQNILREKLPALNEKHFSRNFIEFLNQCVHHDINSRFPAEVLLGSPWFVQYGVLSLDTAIEASKNWISSLVGDRK